MENFSHQLYHSKYAITHRPRHIKFPNALEHLNLYLLALKFFSISRFLCFFICWKWKSHSGVPLFVTPWTIQCTSVQFWHSVMYDSLWLHGLQHDRLPCPSPTPGACSNSCPLSRWCHPTISSSVVPFYSCLQSFPTSGSFPMRQFFSLGGQSIGSFSFSISTSNEYSGLISFSGLKEMDWLDLLEVQGTPKILLQHQSSKA